MKRIVLGGLIVIIIAISLFSYSRERNYRYEEERLIISSIENLSDLLDWFVKSVENGEEDEAIYLLGGIDEKSRMVILLLLKNRMPEGSAEMEVGNRISEIWEIVNKASDSEDIRSDLDELKVSLGLYRDELSITRNVIFDDGDFDDTMELLVNVMGE